MAFWGALSGDTLAALPRRRAPVILIVDDDRDVRELYRACFDTSGYRTAEAATGQQALELARELLPDLLLTDLVLPDLDGLAIAAALKADARTAGVRVIIITGHGTPDLPHRAWAAGAERTILKPCLPDTMLREVRRTLRRSRAARPRLGL